MSPSLYQDLQEQKDNLILRDRLALHRTLLSSETMLLAYVRTALAMFVAGVTLTHFFEDLPVRILGWFLIVFSVVVYYVGSRRHARNEAALKALFPQEKLTPQTQSKLYLTMRAVKLYFQK